MSSVTSPSQQAYSFSDLSLNEIKVLVKFFFTAVLACGIVFGVWIVIPLYWWIGTESSESSPSWTLVSGGVGILILLLFVIYVIRNLDHCLQWFEGFFAGLRKSTKDMSATQRTLLVLFAVAFFYSAIKYPIYWYPFFTLIFMPVVFTIERYMKMITHKSKLKELFDKAKRFGKTGGSVALLLQRMEEGIKVGCAGKYVSWPIEHRIKEAEEKLTVEYKNGQKDLEELLVIASDFKYLVGRWY